MSLTSIYGVDEHFYWGVTPALSSKRYYILAKVQVIISSLY